MSPTGATPAATALFDRMTSFIEEAQRFPPISLDIARITRDGAGNLNKTIRGSAAYLAGAARVADQLTVPTQAMSALAANLERELKGVDEALNRLASTTLGQVLTGEERSSVRDMANMLEVFINGYALTARPGLEKLVVAADGDASRLPSGLGAVMSRIADHATSILMIVDTITGWIPRAHALGVLPSEVG